MKDIGIVQGSASQAVPLFVGKDTVYEHTNIRKVMSDEGSLDLYEYHEVQYTKDEYIDKLMQLNQRHTDDITQMQTLIGYAVTSVDDLILTQADMLFDMCLLEMGIDATEFFDDFDLEEED